MTSVLAAVFIFILSLLPSLASGEDEHQRTVHGYVQQETARRIAGKDEVTKLKQIVQIGAERSLSDRTSFKVTGRFFYDAANDINAGASGRGETEAVLRETYINLSYDDFDLTMGKQQIVWGEVPGLFVADVVTAKDLREFILPGFEYLRIPQWAVNLQFYGSKNTFQLIWLPIQEFDNLPGEESDFFIKPAIPGNIPFRIKEEETPPHSITNGAVGMRWTALLSGWNPALFYLYKYDSMPSYHRSIEEGGEIALTPRHSRIHQLGYSVSKDFDLFVFKSEGVISLDKEFSNSDLNSATGISKNDLIEYAAGVEFYPCNKTTLTLQAFQKIILDHEPEITEKGTDTGMIVRLNPRLFGSTTNPDLLFVYDAANKDWMLRPKITWTVSDSWLLTIGSDLFGGSSEGIFGRFSDKGRAYLELRYDY